MESFFDYFDIWFDITTRILPRLCVVVTVAFVAIRMEWLHKALRHADTDWRNLLVAILVFGLLGVVGNHSGFVFDLDLGGIEKGWVGGGLEERQAIFGFRDSMVMAAGLFAGPWVGLGAGAVAGGERYLLGGFSGPVNAVVTGLLGLIAGLARRSWHRWAETLSGALVLALLGTVLQRVLVLLLMMVNEPGSEDAWLLAKAIAVPMAVLNSLTCFLVIVIARDFRGLDRERLENRAHQAELHRERAEHRAHQAELRAWQARVEPHFLNNALNGIKALILEDPDRARAYVAELGQFFNETRKHAGENSITLGEELTQLRRYVEFQPLLHNYNLRYRADVPAELQRYRLPPLSLQTLIENALTHGFPAPTGPSELCVEAEEREDSLVLKVRDNGRGIPPDKLADLGWRSVVSKHGSGTALYQLKQSLELAFGVSDPISIKSRPGIGTEVILTLPKRSEPWQ